MGHLNSFQHLLPVEHGLDPGQTSLGIGVVFQEPGQVFGPELHDDEEHLAAVVEPNFGIVIDLWTQTIQMSRSNFMSIGPLTIE